MGMYVAKLADDGYCLWSTVVEAPVTDIVTRDTAVEVWGDERVTRADSNGTSIRDSYPAGQTPEEIVAGNHAGVGGEELTVEEILDTYKKEK